ncbi:Clp protease N-terminal domain-containing protein [Actinophytocola sp.]|uniref:Clp protease N-terminal domain-containing protein n=1 Tax=Actinophytocola sp. TaxID=1872138 RepID=UPI002ECFC8CD
MFNQFARAARLAVLEAARDAQNRAAAEVTDEHLLLALINQPETTSAELLRQAGVTSAKVDAAFRTAERKAGLSDAEAATLLRELGIDLDEVVARVEQSLGEKALVGVARPRRHHRPPFAPTAKDIIRGALSQARSLRHKELSNEHLLLALAEHEGVAGQLLAAHGLSYLDVRAQLAKAS